MRIGVLLDRITIGGVEKIAIEEVRAYRDAGIQADLLVLSKDYETPMAFNELLDGINVIHLDSKIPKFFRFSFRMPFFSFFSLFHLTYPILLNKFIKDFQYDYLISHNSYTTFSAKALGAKFNIPYGMYVHDPISYILQNGYGESAKGKMLKTLTPLGLYIDKKILNNASAVFVQGDDHKKFLTSIVKDPAKVFYISPGRNAIETPPTTREPFFLVASAWKHGKNLEQLLTLTSRIEGFRLKVAGKWIQDDYKKIVLGTLKSLNMADRVEILGEVSEGELNNLHQKASAAIIFSQEKGFGLPALEAASNAGTFIIPDDCGAARYFQNNIDGLFYKFGDDASFLDCIDKIIKHPELSYSLGASAWIKVKQEYAWSKHIAVLHNAMNNNSAKQGLTNEEKTRSVHVPERN